MSFAWYIVQARTNTEKSAMQALKDRIKKFEAEAHFGDILVPVEEVVEMRNGQKKISERKFFPGYILVQIATDNGNISSEAWHIVRETPKIVGFVGGTTEKPLPMSDKEAERMLARVQVSKEKPTLKSAFEKGQTVRVLDGPFVDFHGVVEDVDAAHAKVKVMVLVFGRATPVDFGVNQLELAQVTEKA